MSDDNSKKEAIMSLFELDLFEPLIFDDVTWKEALIGLIPLVGALEYLFGGNDEEDDDSTDNRSGRTAAADGGQRGRNNRRRGVTDGRRLEKTAAGTKGILGKIVSFLSSTLGKIMKPKVLGILFGIFFLGFFFVGFASGSGYGLLLSDAIGDPFDGAIGTGLEEAQYQVSRGVAIFSCTVVEGNAGCVREWNLNRSSDLGTESVGDTFEVSMLGPEITGANDVSVREKNDPIPVYFGLKNSRHGIRGVDAENVEYRVKATNPGIPGLDGNTPVCETKWSSISKYPNIESDTTDIDNFNEIDMTLFPGQQFDWENQDEDMTLYRCGLINPGPQGSPHEAKVEAKYDYSTFSILELDAMAEENHEGPRKERKSRSVDTPARTAITTRTAPITFREIDGTTVSDSITLRIWLETDERDTEFRIEEENFVLRDSELTTHVNGSCRGLEPISGEDNAYKLNEEIQRQINRIQENQDDWFSHRSNTPTATCDFELSEPERISETGETVSFRARANYTVKFQEESDGFTLFNGRCDLDNCPYIKSLKASTLQPNIVNSLDLDENSPLDYKTERVDNWEATDYWRKEYAKCNRPIDSKESCSAVESFKYDERRPISDVEPIELGKFAIVMDGEPEQANNFIACSSRSNTGKKQITGVEEEELEDAFNDETKAFAYEGGEWKFKDGISDEEQAC